MNESASTASTLSAVVGRLAARFRHFAKQRVARAPASEAHPPLPPALGAFGMLVGDDHRRN